MFKQRLKRLKELNTVENADIAKAMAYFLEKVANAALYSRHRRVVEIPNPYWSLIMPMLQRESQLHALCSVLFILNCQNFVYGFAEFSDQLAVILYFFEDLQVGAAVVFSASQVKLFRLQKANDK
jgi:hypothetical protein